MRRIIETIVKSKLYLTITIIGILIVLLSGYLLVKQITKKPDRIITSSTLVKIVDVAEFVGAEYTYHGIAEIYKNEKKTKVECYVKYDAVVKAEIDAKMIEFVVDNENKKIKAILPEIKLTATVDDKFSYIPEKNNLEPKNILKSCKEDAIKESIKAGGLVDVAEESFKSNISLLLLPILELDKYTLEWE